MGSGQAGMRVALCPMGYLDIGWSREGGLFGQWKITGGCVTTPGGPGFHRAVVEFLAELSQKELKGLQVQDDTGYWGRRDFGALTEEHYYPWLAGELRKALERLEQSPKSIPLFWGEDADYRPQEIPNTVYTPVGRFSASWLRERLEQDRIQELAQRLFLWPNPVRDALYYRNGALKRMWQDCWFAPSDRSYDDEQVNGFVLDFLEQAGKLDPTLPLPVSAYRELCIMADRDFKISEDAPEMEEEYAPGYHKGELMQNYEELWLPLPGVYRYEWNSDNRGGGLWQDEESESPVWRASRYRGQDSQAEWNQDFSNFYDDVETLELEGGKAHWGWEEVPDNDDSEAARYQVLAEVSVGENLYVVTVTYRNPEAREDIYTRLRGMQVTPKKQ